MTSSYLLAVDGSPGSQKAIEFAAQRAESSGSRLIVAYVIEWSPYSFNTPEENESRHQRREEEIDKATRSVVEPVASMLKERGLDVESVVRHGHPAGTLIELANERGVAQIIIGRRGEGGLKQMMFGSVAANLVQGSSVPVTVVP